MDALNLENYMSPEVMSGIKQIFLAPINQPDMVPTLVPIILGGIVLELYFGKYEDEDLGWNSSVSNSVIWISTGITLYLTADINDPLEQAVTFFLLGIGVLTGYLNFFHKWSSSVAFLASSSGMVYSLAYVSVVIIKSGMPVNQTTIRSAIIALTFIGIGFQIIKILEPPARDDFDIDMSRR